MIDIANRQEVLERLRVLKPEISVLYKVTDMELFGSIVRGEGNIYSDIDVLVDFTKEADMFDLVALSSYLEEKLGRKVDVVPKQALREELRSTVLAEAVRI